MTNTIVVGTQWGDEGKGKIIDVLAKDVDYVIRAQGGHNAGHTVLIHDKEFKLHLIPSGILHDHTKCFLSAGVVLEPKVLVKEIEGLIKLGVDPKGRLFILDNVSVILPHHQYLDQINEERKKGKAIGTTLSGIGPCYSDQKSRIGIRISDFMDKEIFKKKLIEILDHYNPIITEIYDKEPLDANSIFSEYIEYAKFLKPYICSWENWPIYAAKKEGKNTLLEGAQGTYLDINFGTYPFVTSSNTIAAGICVGAGFGPKDIDEVYGIVKSYTTRVGAGPMPTAFDEVEGFPLQQEARELGTTTGRIRRMGWLDLPLIKQAVEINSITSLALTKLDILDQLNTIKVAIAYQVDGKEYKKPMQNLSLLEKATPIYHELAGWQTETTNIKNESELPKEAMEYIKFIEDYCNCPIKIVSVGPERTQTFFRNQ